MKTPKLCLGCQVRKKTDANLCGRKGTIWMIEAETEDTITITPPDCSHSFSFGPAVKEDENFLRKNFWKNFELIGIPLEFLAALIGEKYWMASVFGYLKSKGKRDAWRSWKVEFFLDSLSWAFTQHKDETPGAFFLRAAKKMRFIETGTFIACK